MIKQVANIEIQNPEHGAKAVYFPLKNEVLKGILYSDTATITIILNNNEILLQSFRGMKTKKISPDKKIFHITQALEQPVIIKATSETATNIKVFFITQLIPETKD